MACRAVARGCKCPPSPFGLRRGSLRTLRERRLEPVGGIEPPHPAYKAGPLPLRINRRGQEIHKRTVICSASLRRQLHDHRPIFWTFTMSNSAMPRRHRSSRENARAKARELESGLGLSVSSADHQVPPAVWRRAWSPPVSRVFVRDLVRIA